MTTITPDMSIADVLELDRETARIFLSFGMHCLGCPHATGESLLDAGNAHGIDVDAMIRQLNEHFAANA